MPYLIVRLAGIALHDNLVSDVAVAALHVTSRNSVDNIRRDRRGKADLRLDQKAILGSIKFDLQRPVKVISDLYDDVPRRFVVSAHPKIIEQGVRIGDLGARREDLDQVLRAGKRGLQELVDVLVRRR